MTGILSNQLPGRANPPDADNPLGSFKDRTAPGANDGSYLTQTWSNDRDSILQALFIASGLTPNGIEDTGTASQLFDALINNRWSSIGNYLPGTIVTASDGNQYYCISSNGRDTTVTDPTAVTNRNVWVQYPYQEVVNANGKAHIYFNGYTEQWGSGVTQADGLITLNFPVDFINPPSIVIANEKNAVGWGSSPITAITYGLWNPPTSTSFTIRSVINNDTSQNPVSSSFNWFARS